MWKTGIHSCRLSLSDKTGGKSQGPKISLINKRVNGTEESYHDDTQNEYHFK
jgi:hypothetical protein